MEMYITKQYILCHVNNLLCKVANNLWPNYQATELSPFSQGNNLIGFPDYENGYSVSSDFIANKNGWLYTSATGRWTVLINGKPVRQQVLNSDQIDGAIAPISSGDKVQVIMIQGGSRLNEIIFYPCKQLAASQSNSSKFIPDYTKGKRINSGFVAPYNGVVVALTGANCNGDPAYGSAYLKINGVQVIYWKYEQHGENKVTNSVFVRKGDLVEYGDYVSWWGYRPVSWIVSFYPCK